LKDQYITVEREAIIEIIEKKSRFIATVKNVQDEEDAANFLENIRKNYWDASHNVYAYCIRGDMPIYKCSDDGEPSGTAGIPVLEVIKKEKVEDVVIAVTRYFGGTKLGKGGLVRAYSKSAKEGITAAGIKKRILSVKYRLKTDYTLLAKLQSIAANNGHNIKNVEYTDEIVLEIDVSVKNIISFNREIQEITSGQMDIKEIDRGYYITEC
jgi:uncharacterized YigZ family protein